MTNKQARLTVSLCAVALIGTTLAACAPDTADQKQNRMQEALLDQSVQSIGVPTITAFAEKRLLKDIFELRDKLVPTYSYLAGEMNGTIGEKICDSVGFGIPYATQYTSPQKRDWGNGGVTLALPQADPNGLFSPASAEGTWVLCKVPGSDKIMPQYIEPKIIVLTFPKEDRGKSNVKRVPEEKKVIEVEPDVQEHHANSGHRG